MNYLPDFISSIYTSSESGEYLIELWNKTNENHFITIYTSTTELNSDDEMVHSINDPAHTVHKVYLNQGDSIFGKSTENSIQYQITKL